MCCGGLASDPPPERTLCGHAGACAGAAPRRHARPGLAAPGPPAAAGSDPLSDRPLTRVVVLHQRRQRARPALLPAHMICRVSARTAPPVREWPWEAAPLPLQQVSLVGCCAGVDKRSALIERACYHEQTGERRTAHDPPTIDTSAPPSHGCQSSGRHPTAPRRPAPLVVAVPRSAHAARCCGCDRRVPPRAVGGARATSRSGRRI